MGQRTVKWTGSMDTSALLLVLTRIAEALETANIIAMASYPDVTTSSRSPSASPAPSAGHVPEVQVSAPGTETAQVASSPFVSISEALSGRSAEEGGGGALPGHGRGAGEQEKESSIGCNECRLSGRAACLCYFIGSSIALPTALSPRPRRRSLSQPSQPSQQPPSSALLHPYCHSGTYAGPSIFLTSSDPVDIPDKDEVASPAASSPLVFSFEGDPLEDLDGLDQDLDEDLAT